VSRLGQNLQASSSERGRLGDPIVRVTSRTARWSWPFSRTSGCRRRRHRSRGREVGLRGSGEGADASAFEEDGGEGE
jgi:hypothetical protein